MRILLLLALAIPSYTQFFELGAHAGAHRISPNKIGSAVGETSGNNFDTLLGNGWLFGFRMTVNQGSFFGHEFGYTYNRTQLTFRPVVAGLGTESSQGMAIHRSGYNFMLYATPEGTKIRPFVTGGGQFSNFVPPGASVSQGGGENKFGVNYGAGVKFRLSDRYLIRADLRQYIQGRPFRQFLNVDSGSFRNTEISLGFSFTL
ncbi:MAG: outer membrane beta-barrel protein [Bryobacter sp.]|nr:outer membrane beta-barrel protein [Bryobacter sp.]